MAQQDFSSLVHTIYDAFNNKSYDKAVSIVSDEIEWKNLPFNKVHKGKNGFNEYWHNWATAFPDGKIEVKNLIVGGNFAVAEFIGRGTNTGVLTSPMGQIPATGQSVE